MSAPPDPLIGRELGGCRLLERVGQGGMGAVYKAHHHRLDRIVAVKILPAAIAAIPDAVARFQREARAAARMEHPRIVQVYDVGSESGVHFIVMQYVEGETLADRILRKRKLGPIEAHAIMHAVLEGLSEAHRAGMVHHDVKPSNILLGKDGSIRLADFGIAMPIAQRGETKGEVLGTPHYVSPEQASGVGGDARSDLYSAGATYFHMLAGRPPYMSDDAMAVVQMQINDPLPNVRRLNPSVTRLAAAVIAKLMAKRPQDRYPSAEKAMLDLDAPGVVIGELDSAPIGPEPELPPDIAAEPEHWVPRQQSATPLYASASQALDLPSGPLDTRKILWTARARLFLSSALFFAAALVAYLAGWRGNWAFGGAAAAIFAGASWAAPRRNDSAFAVFALACGASFEAGAAAVKFASVPARELALWAAAACMLLIWVSDWRLLHRSKVALWPVCTAAIGALLYRFGLPDHSAWLSSSGSSGAMNWAGLFLAAAIALKIFRIDNFFLRIAPGPLLLAGASMAYAAGALQWEPPPPVLTGPQEFAGRPSSREGTPAPVQAPAPAPAVRPRKRPSEPYPQEGGHVSVMEIKDEDAAEEKPVPPPPPPPQSQTTASARPARSTDQVQPLVHDDWDPDKDTMNWSLLSEHTSARIWLPLRAFLDKGGPRRALMGGALLLCLLGLGLMLEAEIPTAIDLA